MTVGFLKSSFIDLALADVYLVRPLNTASA